MNVWELLSAIQVVPWDGEPAFMVKVEQTEHLFPFRHWTLSDLVHYLEGEGWIDSYTIDMGERT